ncbi:hypothetical protein D3C87_1474000 [compost metagenome]
MAISFSVAARLCSATSSRLWRSMRAFSRAMIWSITLLFALSRMSMNSMVLTVLTPHSASWVSTAAVKASASVLRACMMSSSLFVASTLRTDPWTTLRSWSTRTSKVDTRWAASEASSMRKNAVTSTSNGSRAAS